MLTCLSDCTLVISVAPDSDSGSFALETCCDDDVGDNVDDALLFVCCLVAQDLHVEDRSSDLKKHSCLFFFFGFNIGTQHHLLLHSLHFK